MIQAGGQVKSSVSENRYSKRDLTINGKELFAK